MIMSFLSLFKKLLQPQYKCIWAIILVLVVFVRIMWTPGGEMDGLILQDCFLDNRVIWLQLLLKTSPSAHIGSVLLSKDLSQDHNHMHKDLLLMQPLMHTGIV